jgi:ubiquinone/menaquinone biosynthesis C-methylase UbiE
MGFYNDRVVPWLIDKTMRQQLFLPYRQNAVAGAEGRVLEIGIGSGLNLALYPSAVTEVVGIEPSEKLLQVTRRNAGAIPFRVELVEGSAEKLPFEDASFDTVVSTWTMCSIPDVSAALSEMRRVLKPGGRLLFVEHGLSPDKGVRWWQDHLNSPWRCLAGGCNLNRSIPTLVQAAGFHLDHLETGYATGPKPLAYLFQGSARG